MGVTLLWKYCKKVSDSKPPGAEEGDLRDIIGGRGDSRTLIIDGGWLRFLCETAPGSGARRFDRSGAPAAPLTPQDLAYLPRISYERMNAALRGWLDKFVGAGVNRVVVCLDGVFNVQKAEEAHMRTRDRYADSLNLEKRLVRYPDPTFIRTKLSGNEGFLPRLVAQQLVHTFLNYIPRTAALEARQMASAGVPVTPRFDPRAGGGAAGTGGGKWSPAGASRRSPAASAVPVAPVSPIVDIAATPSGVPTASRLSADAAAYVPSSSSVVLLPGTSGMTPSSPGATPVTVVGDATPVAVAVPAATKGSVGVADSASPSTPGKPSPYHATPGSPCSYAGVASTGSINTTPAVTLLFAEGESDMLCIHAYRKLGAAAIFANDSDYLVCQTQRAPSGGGATGVSTPSSDLCVVNADNSDVNGYIVNARKAAGEAWPVKRWNVAVLQTLLLADMRKKAVAALALQEVHIPPAITMTPHLLYEAAAIAGNDWLEHYYDRAKLPVILNISRAELFEWVEDDRYCRTFAARSACTVSGCTARHEVPPASGALVFFPWVAREALRWSAANGQSDTSAWRLELSEGVKQVCAALPPDVRPDFDRSLAYARAVYGGDASFYERLHIMADTGGVLTPPISTPPATRAAALTTIAPGAHGDAATGAGASATPDSTYLPTSSLAQAVADMSARVQREYSADSVSLASIDGSGGLADLIGLDFDGLRQRSLFLISRGMDVYTHAFLHAGTISATVGQEWTPTLRSYLDATSSGKARKTGTPASNGAGSIAAGDIRGACKHVTLSRGLVMQGLDGALAALLRMKEFTTAIPAFAGLTVTDIAANKHRGGVYNSRDDTEIEARNIKLEVVKLRRVPVGVGYCASPDTAIIPLDSIGIARLSLTPQQRWGLVELLVAAHCADLHALPAAATGTASGAPVTAGKGAAKPAAAKGRFAALESDGDSSDDEDGDEASVAVVGRGVSVAKHVLAHVHGGDCIVLTPGTAPGQVVLPPMRASCSALQPVQVWAASGTGIEVGATTSSTDNATASTGATSVPQQQLKGPWANLAVVELAVSYLSNHCAAYSDCWNAVGLHVLDESVTPFASKMGDCFALACKYALIAQALLLQLSRPGHMVEEFITAGVPLATTSAGSLLGAGTLLDEEEGRGYDKVAGAVDRFHWLHAMTAGHWFEDGVNHISQLLHLTSDLEGVPALAVPAPAKLFHHKLYLKILEAAGFFASGSNAGVDYVAAIGGVLASVEAGLRTGGGMEGSDSCLADTAIVSTFQQFVGSGVRVSGV